MIYLTNTITTEQFSFVGDSGNYTNNTQYLFEKAIVRIKLGLDSIPTNKLPQILEVSATDYSHDEIKQLDLRPGDRIMDACGKIYEVKEIEEADTLPPKDQTLPIVQESPDKIPRSDQLFHRPIQQEPDIPESDTPLPLEPARNSSSTYDDPIFSSFSQQRFSPTSPHPYSEKFDLNTGLPELIFSAPELTFRQPPEPPPINQRSTRVEDELDRFPFPNPEDGNGGGMNNPPILNPIDFSLFEAMDNMKGEPDTLDLNQLVTDPDENDTHIFLINGQAISAGDQIYSQNLYALIEVLENNQLIISLTDLGEEAYDSLQTGEVTMINEQWTIIAVDNGGLQSNTIKPGYTVTGINDTPSLEEIDFMLVEGMDGIPGLPEEVDLDILVIDPDDDMHRFLINGEDAAAGSAFLSQDKLAVLEVLDGNTIQILLTELGEITYDYLNTGDRVTVVGQWNIVAIDPGELASDPLSSSYTVDGVNDTPGLEEIDFMLVEGMDGIPGPADEVSLNNLIIDPDDDMHRFQINGEDATVGRTFLSQDERAVLEVLDGNFIRISLTELGEIAYDYLNTGDRITVVGQWNIVAIDPGKLASDPLSTSYIVDGVNDTPSLEEIDFMLVEGMDGIPGPADEVSLNNLIIDPDDNMHRFQINGKDATVGSTFLSQDERAVLEVLDGNFIRISLTELGEIAYDYLNTGDRITVVSQWNIVAIDPGELASDPLSTSYIVDGVNDTPSLEEIDFMLTEAMDEMKGLPDLVDLDSLVIDPDDDVHIFKINGKIAQAGDTFLSANTFAFMEVLDGNEIRISLTDLGEKIYNSLSVGERITALNQWTIVAIDPGNLESENIYYSYSVDGANDSPNIDDHINGPKVVNTDTSPQTGNICEDGSASDPEGDPLSVLSINGISDGSPGDQDEVEGSITVVIPEGTFQVDLFTCHYSFILNTTNDAVANLLPNEELPLEFSVVITDGEKTANSVLTLIVSGNVTIEDCNVFPFSLPLSNKFQQMFGRVLLIFNDQQASTIAQRYSDIATIEQLANLFPNNYFGQFAEQETPLHPSQGKSANQIIEPIDLGTNLNASGGNGNDYLDGGIGNNRLSGGEGVDIIYGGRFENSENSDGILASGEFPINILPNEGGDDSLSGGECSDYLHGGGGNDQLTGGSGNDLLIGGEGNDRINGGSGNDIISAGAGDDGFGAEISGNAGHDVIDGGTGQDFLNGGQGEDLISGGFKSFDSTKESGFDFDNDPDFLTGGQGADTFFFTLIAENGTIKAPGLDTILDFNISQGDTLAFDIVIVTINGNVNDAGDFSAEDLDSAAVFHNINNSLVISFNGGGGIILNNYTTNDFDSFQSIESAGAFSTAEIVQYI